MLTTHTVHNVVWRLNQRNELELLAHDYSSLDPDTGIYTNPELRFPTGTSGSGELGETVEETSVRKLAVETGLLALDTEEIARRSAEHPRHVCLIDYDWCLGDLHPGPVEVGNDRMSVPYWISAEKLRILIAPVHFWIYQTAMRKLEENLPSYLFHRLGAVA